MGDFDRQTQEASTGPFLDAKSESTHEAVVWLLCRPLRFNPRGVGFHKIRLPFLFGQAKLFGRLGNRVGWGRAVMIGRLPKRFAWGRSPVNGELYELTINSVLVAVRWFASLFCAGMFRFWMRHYSWIP